MKLTKGLLIVLSLLMFSGFTQTAKSTDDSADPSDESEVNPSVIKKKKKRLKTRTKRNQRKKENAFKKNLGAGIDN